MTIDSKDISVRDLTESDIPFILDYWFRSPPGFIAAMGVDLAKVPKEPEMEKALREKLRANRALPSSKLNVVIIQYKGQAVGIHTLNPLVEGDHGIFHAHICDPSYRGRGIALRSYVLACRLFMERFELGRILFKTPIQNRGSIRVKEKLGIRFIGEEKVGFGVIQDGTLARVFELTASEARELGLE